jgi:carboxypeptidase PM20D1
VIFPYILGAIFMLLFIAVLRALALKAKPLPSEPQFVPDDSSRILAEHMSAMLQNKTISLGPGATEEEKNEFVKFRGLLKKLYPRCFSAMEDIDLGCGAILLRLRGKGEKSGAVVLMSHHDVVPAPGEWKHPPFSGTIADGAIWGRGAVDTKGSLCAIFEAVESLLAEGFAPNTDIFISSSNAEEIGGEGAKCAAEYLEKKGIPVALVTDEGGRLYDNPMPGAKGRFAMVSVTEKGHGTLKFTAKSAGGHASASPLGKKNPLVRLAGFIMEAENHPPFRKKISPELKATFKAIAPYMSFPFRLLFVNLWLFKPLILAALPKVSPQAGSMLRTTCVFTGASGGDADNSAPETASLTANLRFIHHQPREESIKAICALARKYDLGVEVEKSGECCPVTDVKGPGFRFIAECIKDQFPEAAIAPMTLVAGTDARNFNPICHNVIRFVPLVMSKQQLASVHGIDENITLSSLVRAVDFYRSMLLKLQNKNLEEWI